MPNIDNSISSGHILPLPTKDTTIEHGDWVVYDGGTHDILPATGANQDIYLCGVAQTASLDVQGVDGNGALVSAKIDTIAVATTGVYEFTVASGTYYIGEKFKMAGPDSVAKCSTNETAVGVCVENTAGAVTKVKIKIGHGMTNQNMFLGG